MTGVIGVFALDYQEAKQQRAELLIALADELLSLQS
jgi:hypothetical protein